MTDSNINLNEQSVLMSPLLSNRFNKIEKKLENIETSYKDINEKFDTILQLLVENSKRWDDNKKEYIELLENNQKISEKNYAILNENKSIYSETVNKLNSHNDESLFPLLQKLEKNNNKLCSNMDPRIYNRYWRTSGNNTIMKPPANFGIGSIINFPWFSKT